MVKNTDSVTAAERALSLLLAFRRDDRRISLAELSRRTELDKATVLRLARTLAASGFLVRNDDSSWRLGPSLARLGLIYQETLVPGDIVAPLLEELAQSTGESVAVYVREGDRRVCLFRHESAQSIRHAVRVGSVLPLDQGAPGRVILAFEGVAGEPYDTIRARGYHKSFGERDPQVASVAVPLFELGDRLFGSLTVTGPPSRFTEASVENHLAALREASKVFALAMGGTASEADDVDRPDRRKDAGGS